MSRLCKAFLINQSGATAVEYGLIASLIGVVMIGALTNLATRMSSEFAELGGAMTNGVSVSSGASSNPIEAPVAGSGQMPLYEAVSFSARRPAS